MNKDGTKSQSANKKIFNYLTKNESFNIFKAVPSALGIGGAALAVFYYLLSEILKLEIFEKLSAYQTFLTIALFLIVITIVVTFALWLWYKNAKNKLDSTQYEKKTGADFDVPEHATFRSCIDGVAKMLNLITTFEGFTDEQLNSKLESRRIKASSWIEALKLLGQLSKHKELPSYSVVKGDGTLNVKVLES